MGLVQEDTNKCQMLLFLCFFLILKAETEKQAILVIVEGLKIKNLNCKRCPTVHVSGRQEDIKLLQAFLISY